MVAMEKGTNEDRYRLLEMIESKIAVGLFKIGKDSAIEPELQIFLKEVDIIYKGHEYNKTSVSHLSEC
jgi:hypothetical protein